MEAKLGAVVQIRIHIMWRGQIREASTYFDITILLNLMENSVAKSPTILMPLIQLVLILVSLCQSNNNIIVNLKRSLGMRIESPLTLLQSRQCPS